MFPSAPTAAMPNPVTRDVFECFLTDRCLRGEALSVDDVAVIRAYACVDDVAVIRAYADQQKAALDIAILKLDTANERIKLDAETIKAVIKARDAKNTHE